MAVVNARRFRPEARVSFYTEKGCLVIRNTVAKEGDAIDSDIISITTTTDLSTDAGTFQITLSQRNRWDKVLASNDRVEIAMRRNDGVSWEDATVFVGLIDDVRKNVEVQESNIHRTITVTGRSFAKALINFEVGTIDTWSGSSTGLAWYNDSQGSFGGGTVKRNIEMFFNNVIFKYMDYEFSDGKTFKSLTHFPDYKERGIEVCEFDENWNTFQGTSLEFIRELANEPWNQFYWECYEGYPCFVIRPTPFNKEEWEQLPRYRVTDDFVMSNDVGRSDLETYTFYAVKDALEYTNSYPVNPYYYEPYMSKYGCRMLTRYSKYVSTSGDQITADEGFTSTNSSSDSNTESDQESKSVEPRKEIEAGQPDEIGDGSIGGSTGGNTGGNTNTDEGSTTDVSDGIVTDSSGSGAGTNSDKVAAFQEMLFNWNILNPRFWNGTITIIGTHQWKIGDRLIYDSEEDGRSIEYYVEGVQHNFTNFQSWTTKLSVTRGLEENGKSRFDDPVGKFKEYQGGFLGMDEEVQNVSSSDSSSDGGGGFANITLTGKNTGEKIANLALEYCNKKTVYKYGRGRSVADFNKGYFDCSSFCWWMYHLCGIDLCDMASANTKFIRGRTKVISSKSQLLPGDLVYWNTTAGHDGHIGIYVGTGRAVACNGPENKGKVEINDLSQGYWKSVFSTTMRRGW